MRCIVAIITTLTLSGQTLRTPPLGDPAEPDYQPSAVNAEKTAAARASTAFGDVGGVNGMLAAMTAPSSGWGASAMGPMQMRRQLYDDPPGTFLRSLTGAQTQQTNRLTSITGMGLNSLSGNRFGQNFWTATRPQSTVPQFNFSGFTGRSNNAGSGANFFAAFAGPLNSILSGHNPSGLNFSAQILASQFSPWQRSQSGSAFRTNMANKGGQARSEEHELTAWAEKLAMTSNATTGRPAQVEARLQQIQDEVARVYYTNESLQSLRAEYYSRQMRLAFSDPLYLYWFTELDRVLQRIYTTRPSYNAYASLAREVGSWTIPNDPGNAELARRYARRRLLEQTYQQLSAEVDWVMLLDRNTANWVAQVQNWLNAKAAGWLAQTANRAWNADWERRWAAAAQSAISRSNLSAMITSLSQDFSTLDQTLRAAQSIDQSSASLANNATVLRAVNLAGAAEDAVLQSSSIQSRVNSLYSAYTTELLSALGSTNFAVETERYWERMNGLIQNDTAYRNLQTLQFPAVVSLNATKDRVYQEVGACLAQLGNFCDPVVRPGVRAALGEPNLSGWITLAGAFTELHCWVQYRLQVSPTATQIDADTANRLNTAVNQVSFRLQTARDRFNAGISSIPEINRLNELRLAAFTAMQQGSADFRARAAEFQRLALTLQ